MKLLFAVRIVAEASSIPPLRNLCLGIVVWSCVKATERESGLAGALFVRKHYGAFV